MKPIIEKQNKKTILTSEITTKHIVVGIINSFPSILTNGEFEGDRFKFRCINQYFTNGNGFLTYKTIQEAVESELNSGYKLEVFHEKDWKKALQWLIDNAE